MNSAFLRAVNLTKYHCHLKRFVLILTITATFSCARQPYAVTKIEGREIGVTDKFGAAPEYENVIKPYRDHIESELNTILAYSPQTLDKNQGQWQTAIGNLMADATMLKTSSVFKARTGNDIDMCLLNFGGIRSIIPKGNVTTRTAFEIMPFENSLVVAQLSGDEILNMVNYIIAEKKAHPVSGLKFAISKNNTPKDIIIAGEPLQMSKQYFVVTSDYLLNGGDRMDFFLKSARNTSLDYKLRNVLIDYFKDVDTIPVITDIRIHQEQ